MRPPPLVAAGLDVVQGKEGGRAVTVGGLAVIFGIFPASPQDFLQLAGARLHLNPGQASELDPVLNTRILALWAWLPTLRQDCYLEFDRATGSQHLWTIGPGEGECHELDAEDPPAQLAEAFLAGVVLNGSGHWGGEAGLAKLVERFGPQPLLVAARIADHLDHKPKELREALDIARACWPALALDDEPAWAALADHEHPWVNVQIGRLALRLGLVRAARVLLRFAAGTEVQPVAHFDLGQAQESLGDLAAAEAAFARYAAARPNDPDAWRRLLFCRLRLGHLAMAGETLKRYRTAGGRDRDLAERFLALAGKPRLPASERAVLAGWMMAELGEAVLLRIGLLGLMDEIIARRCGGSGTPMAKRFEDATQFLHATLTQTASQVPHGADEATVAVLVAVGFLIRPRPGAVPPPAAELAHHAAAALALWNQHRLAAHVAPVLPDEQALERLAVIAMETSSE
jgi:hypothetical protein